MKPSKFSDTQIVRILSELESGAKVIDTCRKHNVSSASIYKWRSKFTGVNVHQLKRLKELEAENDRLKNMYSELSRDHHILKDLLGKSPEPRATCRTEVLDRYIFNSLTEVRRQTEVWRQHYNTDRPHKALGGLPPNDYAMANCQSLPTSSRIE